MEIVQDQFKRSRPVQWKPAIALVTAAIAVIVGVWLFIGLFTDSDNADEGRNSRRVPAEVDLTVHLEDRQAVDGLLRQIRAVDGVVEAHYLAPGVVQGIVPDAPTLELEPLIEVLLEDSSASEPVERAIAALPGVSRVEPSR